MATSPEIASDFLHFLCDKSYNHVPIESEDTKPTEEYTDLMVKHIHAAFNRQSKGIEHRLNKQTFVDKILHKVINWHYAVCFLTSLIVRWLLKLTLIMHVLFII